MSGLDVFLLMMMVLMLFTAGLAIGASLVNRM